MKRIVILFLSILMYNCSNKEKSEAAEFFNRGNYHFKKREYDKAKEFFSEAIEKQPKLADAYHNRAIIYELEGKFELANEDYLKSIELDAKFYEAYQSYAEFLLKVGREFDARDILNELPESYKDSTRYIGINAELQLMLGNLNEAIALFSILEKPTLQQKTNLGVAYYQLKDMQNAKRIFKEVLKVDDQFAYAINNLSAISSYQGNVQEALELSKMAISINSTQLQFINTHVLNLMDAYLFEEAENFQLKAEKIDANNPYVKRNKAILLIKRGEIEGAKTILEQVEKEHPETEYIYYYLAKVNKEPCEYLKKGRFLKDPRSIKEAISCK